MAAHLPNQRRLQASKRHVLSLAWALAPWAWRFCAKKRSRMIPELGHQIVPSVPFREILRLKREF